MPQQLDFTRPYLVIPKLVEQPTWGGTYIAQAKGWADRPGHDRKIGQAYELFSGTNLSFLDHSDDPAFAGELTDRDAVEAQTRPANSVALADMLASDPKATLGAEHIQERGTDIGMLIKFTQALGNSFQVHIKAGEKHPRWKPKPESWYYFEPGLLTLGVRPNADWDIYRQAVTNVNNEMSELGKRVQNGKLSYDEAQQEIASILEKYNPWQYVNLLAVQKDQLIDLSAGGQHHSWEEDPVKAPLGNVLYELQAEALDNVSTFRSFDKGKMGADGTIRPVHIDEYFDNIDRSPEANDPLSHIKKPTLLSESDAFRHELLMRSPYYALDKITLHKTDDVFREQLTRYKHYFVKQGGASVTANGQSVFISASHSCFVPAAAKEVRVTATAPETEILVSF